jgi:hypothetical protein
MIKRPMGKTAAIENQRDEDEGERAQGRHRLAGKIAGNFQSDTTRERSNYSDIRGTPDAHCGNDHWWMKGGCKFFRDPNKCVKVSGYIAPRGRCDWYKSDGK